MRFDKMQLSLSRFENRDDIFFFVFVWKVMFDMRLALGVVWGGGAWLRYKKIDMSRVGANNFRGIYVAKKKNKKNDNNRIISVSFLQRRTVRYWFKQTAMPIRRGDYGETLCPRAACPGVKMLNKDVCACIG